MSAISFVWSFLTGNLWRTLAIGMLALSMVQALRIDSMRSAAESCAVQLSVAADSIKAAAESASHWEVTANQINERLTRLVEAIRVQREREAEALRKADAKRREADHMLAMWMDRYAKALRDPDCALLMEQPLCAI